MASGLGRVTFDVTVLKAFQRSVVGADRIGASRQISTADRFALLNSVAKLDEGVAGALGGNTEQSASGAPSAQRRDRAMRARRRRDPAACLVTTLAVGGTPVVSMF